MNPTTHTKNPENQQACRCTRGKWGGENGRNILAASQEIIQKEGGAERHKIKDDVSADALLIKHQVAVLSS